MVTPILATTSVERAQAVRACGAVASRFALVRVALRAGFAGGAGGHINPLAARPLPVGDALQELAD